ncbi:MAG: hypothetical protein ACJARY_001024 [Candidatus Azotimanducaceae bacterium]|jgi:hypothetical protein
MAQANFQLSHIFLSSLRMISVLFAISVNVLRPKDRNHKTYLLYIPKVSPGGMSGKKIGAVKFLATNGKCLIND